jgi:phosphate/sulfate permease
MIEYYYEVYGYAGSVYGTLILILWLAQPIIVAIIAGLFHRESKRRKKDNEKIEKRAAIRAEESLLSMRMMSANTRLAIAAAIAIKEDEANGEMDSALDEAKKAQRDCYDFMSRMTAAHVTKE